MPKTRLLMIVSAMFLLICMFTLMLAPAEALSPLGIAPGAENPLAIQLLNAALLGFSILNWTAKDNIIGGIYARPVSTGNFLHFGVGAVVLVKAIFAGATHPVVVILAGGYVIFAVAFGWLVFGQGSACVDASGERPAGKND